MKKLLFFTAMTLAVLTAGVAHAEKVVIIGLDHSGSAPLVSDQAFPGQAAKRIEAIVSKLEYGDKVLLRTFGEYVERKNSLTQDFELNRRYKPEVVARSIAKFVSGYAGNHHTVDIEDQTNILGWLENQVAQYSCSDHEVYFILLSDGIEYSQLANGYEMIKTGRGTLPQLRFVSFKGCNMSIWGLGYKMDVVGVQNLKRVWFDWGKAAELKSINLQNDW